MSERIFESLKELLTQQGAHFRVVAHESAGTSAEVAKARGTQLGQGAKALVCTIKGFKNGQISFVQNLNLASADDAQNERSRLRKRRLRRKFNFNRRSNLRKRAAAAEAS